MPRIGIIVVAGGSGTRMGTEVPKQFLSLNGKPILVHTIERLRSVLPDSPMIVALPAAETERWTEIASEFGIEHSHTVVHGGATRFDSVKNALGMLEECDIVAVHDGVRPFITKQLIERIFSATTITGAAIPVIVPEDSFRVIPRSRNSHPMDRNKLRAVQTPQVFSAQLLRRAYETEYEPRFTDDASVVERLGIHITLCDGDQANIKITTPFHILLAETLLKNDKWH